MASFSSHAQVISRGKGRSAVAAAAYRAGEKIKNEWDGRTHDYSHKQGILYAEIFTPDNAPDWMHDRSKLWNMVEQIEKRKDAQLAREIRASLPQELTQQQNIQLASDYAKQFVREGMIADIAIHDKQDSNPHIHIMLTMRPLEGDDFGKKNRDWNRNENVEKWREQLADLTNDYLERYGHKDRVDPRSYEEQGIEKKAKVHLSRYAYELEQKGIPTEKGDINRGVEAENNYRDKAKQALELIDKAIKEEEERLKREMERREKDNAVHHEAEHRRRQKTEPLSSYRERYEEAHKRRLVRDPDRPNRNYKTLPQKAKEREKPKQPDPSPPEKKKQKMLDEILHEIERRNRGVRNSEYDRDRKTRDKPPERPPPQKHKNLDDLLREIERQQRNVPSHDYDYDRDR